MDPEAVVVMGVTGTGKSTVGAGIARRMGWSFADGDDFHPPASIAKMHGGIPLTDADRWPWLRSIGEWIGEQLVSGTSAVVACSALRRAYRDLLRDGRPGVRFLHLHDSEQLISSRLATRQGHFMAPGLLISQLATLEPLEPDEPGAVVGISGEVPEVIERAILALGLGHDRTRS